MTFQAKATPALALIGIKGIDGHYDSKHLSSNNSRLDQLQDYAADPDPDVIELATGDLYKEFPGREGAEDSYEEDMYF
jgi:hypothetical protein